MPNAENKDPNQASVGATWVMVENHAHADE